MLLRGSGEPHSVAFPGVVDELHICTTWYKSRIPCIFIFGNFSGGCLNADVFVYCTAGAAENMQLFK